MPVVFRWPDDAGYERFVHEHGPAVARLAFLVTGNWADAEDVVQDAVIAVAAKWSTVQAGTELAYLRRAVVNRATDVVRRRRWAAGVEAPDSAVAESGYLRLESDQRFVQLLQGLPARQRAVLVLRFSYDLDDAAVAAALGCSVRTVRSQASRGLAKLRAQLSREGGAADGSPAAAQ